MVRNQRSSQRRIGKCVSEPQNGMCRPSFGTAKVKVTVLPGRGVLGNEAMVWAGAPRRAHVQEFLL